VDDDPASKRPRLGRRKQPFQIAPAELPRESAGHQDRLALVPDTARRQLVEDGRQRFAARIRLSARKRESRGLYDDRHPRGGGQPQLGERLLVEREAEGVSDRRPHVDDPRRWCGRLQEDVVVTERDVDDARAGEQRDAAHRLSLAQVQERPSGGS